MPKPVTEHMCHLLLLKGHYYHSSIGLNRTDAVKMQRGLVRSSQLLLGGAATAWRGLASSAAAATTDVAIVGTHPGGVWGSIRAAVHAAA